MKVLIIVLALLCLLACSVTKTDSAISKPKEIFFCEKSINSEEANKSIMNQIYEKCDNTYENYARQESNKGTIKLDTNYITSKYTCKTDVSLYSALVKPVDTLRSSDGSIISIKFCIKNSDAAKPYLEKQRILADSMKMAIWPRVQGYWNDFMNIQIRLDGLGVESEYFYSAKKSYEKARDDYEAAKENSLLRSLVPFGFAQFFYKEHPIRGTLYLLSEGTFLALGINSLSNSKEADRNYKNTLRKYESSTNLNEKNELLKKSKNYKSEKESAEYAYYRFFGIAAGLWLVNIVDGYKSEPDLSRFHSVILPIPSQNGIGVAFALTGSF